MPTPDSKDQHSQLKILHSASSDRSGHWTVPSQRRLAGIQELLSWHSHSSSPQPQQDRINSRNTELSYRGHLSLSSETQIKMVGRYERIYYHIPAHQFCPSSAKARHTGADWPHTARHRRPRAREDRRSRTEPRPTCLGTARSRHTCGQQGCSARSDTATLPPDRRRPGRRTHPSHRSTE